MVPLLDKLRVWARPSVERLTISLGSREWASLMLTVPLRLAMLPLPSVTVSEVPRAREVEHAAEAGRRGC